MQTTTRVKGMAGLIAALPQIIGGRPQPGLILLLEAPDGIAAASLWPAAALPPRDWASEARALRSRVRSTGARAGLMLACGLDPGVLDVVRVADAFGCVLPIHHALTLTEGHWWAVRCDLGCCDGAVHPRPDVVPAASPCPDMTTTALAEAWGRIAEVSAGAQEGLRRARSDDLAVVLDGLSSPQTRDVILHGLAPELTTEHSDCVTTVRTMSSDDLRGWSSMIPDEHRGIWSACEAMALWREADLARATVAAATAVELSGTSLALLMCDILASGMSYTDAVARLRR